MKSWQQELLAEGLSSVDRPPKHPRLLYWAQNLVWVWVGCAAALSGLQFFLDPASTEKSAIARRLSNHFDYSWNILFILAGLALVTGVLSRRRRIEMVGHWLFNAGVIPDCIAILIVTDGGPSFWITLGIGAASISRLYVLMRTTPKRTPRKAKPAS